MLTRTRNTAGTRKETPGGSPRMSSEHRRAAIMEAAVHLFAERGFRGTTTRALAEAVGVSEPVLYEHFKSKRELYAAIIAAKSQAGIALANARVAPYAQAKDDRRVFTELGEFILERHRVDPDYTRLLLHVGLEDRDLAALFHRHQASSRELLAGYIRERIEDGAFRRVDPAIAARSFLGMLLHQGLWSILYHDEFVRGSPKEIVSGMVDIFLKGISRSKGRK